MQVININVSAGITGFESPSADYSSRPLLLDDILIERRSSTFIAVASGDSMTGFGIFDGDLIVVDRAAEKRDLDIVVAVINGELVCKQIDRAKGILNSGNCLYPAMSIGDCDVYVEEGIVIRSVRLFRQPTELLSYFK